MPQCELLALDSKHARAVRPGAAFLKHISFFNRMSPCSYEGLQLEINGVLYAKTVQCLSFVRLKNNVTQQPVRERNTQRVSPDVANHRTRSRSRGQRGGDGGESSLL